MAKTTELELAIKIAGRVDPSLQAAISQAQRQVSTFSATMGTVGRVGLAAIAMGTVAAVKGIADCTKEAEAFESQMAPVVRYVEGLADAEGKVSDAAAYNGKTFKENYGAMAEYIQDLSTQIPRTTEQIATMSAALGQSGKDVEEQLNSGILKDTAVAATAMDLADDVAGKYMAKWEEAFNFSHEQVMALMDQINYLGAHNATTAAEIAESVNRAASMGQIAGIDPAATAALATAMQATGVATDRVGTSITRIYTNLAQGENATKAQKAMFEELGLTAEGVAKSMQEADGGGVRTLLQVFDAIKQLPEERKVAALSTLFGRWAIEGGAKIVNNMDVYEQALKDMQDPEKYTGSMQREFIIQADTTESVSFMAANAKQTLMQSIGEDFLPAKKEFSLLMIDVMNGIRHNMPQITNLATTLADIARNGIEALGTALQGAMPYIQQGLDYLNQNGEKAAKVLAGVVGGFAAMSLAPQAETLLRGGAGLVKAGAGLFGGAVNAVAGNPTKGGRQSIGAALLGRVTGAMANTGSVVTNTQNFVQAAGSTNGGFAGTAWTLLKNKIMGGNSGTSLLGEAVQTPGLLNYMPTLRQALAANPAGAAVGNAVGGALGGIRNYVGGVIGAATANNGNILTNLGNTGLGQAVRAAHQTAQMNGGNTLDTLLQSVGIAAQPVQWLQTTGQWARQSITQMPLVQVPMQAARNAAGFVRSGAGRVAGFAGNVAGTVGGAASAVINSPIAQAMGGLANNAIGGVATAVSPFLNAFGGIASAALPVVAVIGSIVAAVSILGDHLNDIRSIIGNVFGEQGTAVFDGFVATVTGVKDKILGIFSEDNLAAARNAVTGLFGENAGATFDGIVEIGKSVVGVFGQIAEFGTGKLKPMFEQVFGWAGQTLLPAMMNLFNESAPHIASLVTNIGTAVMNVAGIIASAIQALLPIIGNIVMAVVSIATTVGPPILQAISAIAQNIGTYIAHIQGIFDGLIQFINNIFARNWAGAWEGVKQIFGNAFGALVELCKIPINAVIGLINGAIRGINSIVGKGVQIPKWLGGGTFSLSLPEIPMLARGGFTNGVSIAGEAGTEAVISFDPAYRARNIANWQKAGQMLGINDPQAQGAEIKPIPAAAQAAGTIVFSPNITIQGNADYNAVSAALENAQEMFEQWYYNMQRRTARTAYAQ